MPLSPDSKEIINGLTVYKYNLFNHNPNKISMPAAKRKKTVAITIHNTGWINVASNTTPAEQYVRATQNGAMNSVRVHYYVDNKCAWQCMPDEAVNWSCADGTSNANSGNNTSVAIEVVGDSKEAETNAVKLAAYLLNKYNLTVDSGLRTHTYWLNVRDGKKGTVDYLNTLKHPYKWCLPIDATELLTPNGWKNLGDIKKGDLIAQFDKNTISFVECQDVVEPYEETVLKTRYLEATANHRMYAAKYSSRNNYYEVLWGDILNCNNAHRIPTNGFLDEATGLELDDNELLLLAWIQGDGHYMEDRGKITGIEFHLKKERKINRIEFILNELGIPFCESWCANGSVHIRIYDKKYCDWAETWLEDKKFTFKMLNMDKHQFEIFMDELYIIDGHINDRQKMYTSAEIENLNFVQALCATHGTRSSLCTLGTSKKYWGDQPVCLNVLKTNASFVKNDNIEERKTMVSCVSVPSSYILIRQYNHTFVVGNCPAYILPHWADFKKAVIDNLAALKEAEKPVEKPVPEVEEPKPSAAKPVEEKKYYRIRKDWSDAKSQIGAFTSLENAIKKWQEGYFIYDSDGNVVYPEKKAVDITYCVYSCNKWNGDIKNYNEDNASGYAGIKGRSMNGLVMKASEGTIFYKVHIKNGGWLSWISKYEKTNWYNGCAGLKTQEIDAIQVRLEGLEGYNVRYRVSTPKHGYLPWVVGAIDYAGIIGYPIDRIQAEIIKTE